MKPVKNIFMCLVHENQDCIIDLVRNLRYLDPDSIVLLYNGGTDQHLFDHFPFERYGAVIHPEPKPLKWGWLHDFAIDCMEYALKHFDFDLITVVDSDQLACGKGYSHYVAPAFHSDPKFGMFGQIPEKLPLDTAIHPAITAYKELEMWQPFMETLPNGKDAFLHWTFWPSTAFSVNAARDLVKLFRTNKKLHELLSKTSIWASEEILFPTLTIALGYSILPNPCSYTYVQYRKFYGSTDIQQALASTECFWIHPVDRKINDANRIKLRIGFDNYSNSAENTISDSYPALIQDIQRKTTGIEGWLSSEELALLVTVSGNTIQSVENPVIVEIGSYCGKATSVLGLTAKALNPAARIVAIDEFNGRLGAEDTRIDHYPPSYNKFIRALDFLDIQEYVTTLRGRTSDIDYTERIDLLFIDGLHDYANVSRDFYRFEEQLSPDACILFHDYSAHFPGVMAFVEECIGSGNYTITERASSLICLQRTENTEQLQISTIVKKELPLVSCIVPTYNRSQFLERAIEQFLQQDYPNKELIIVDDSERLYAMDRNDNPGIRYVHLPKRSTIGKKRNLACEMASGSIIVHLDDDDFYATDWLTRQITFLQTNKLDVTGLNTPLFYDGKTSDIWQYTYPEYGKPWVYGATLCYTRSFWESNRFPEINCGEDNHFVWNNEKVKLRAHPSLHSYLGNIHPGNTSPKELKDARWKQLPKERTAELKHFLD